MKKNLNQLTPGQRGQLACGCVIERHEDDDLARRQGELLFTFVRLNPGCREHNWRLRGYPPASGHFYKPHAVDAGDEREAELIE